MGSIRPVGAQRGAAADSCLNFTRSMLRAYLLLPAIELRPRVTGFGHGTVSRAFTPAGPSAVTLHTTGRGVAGRGDVHRP